MTYLQFHLLFNLPALLVLLWLTRGRLERSHGRWIAVSCGIVFLVTTPWDNWAVYRGIWSFDWARTTPVAVSAFGIEWRLPAEEYAFFLIETVLISLVTILTLPAGEHRRPAGQSERTLPRRGLRRDAEANPRDACAPRGLP